MNQAFKNTRRISITIRKNNKVVQTSQHNEVRLIDGGYGVLTGPMVSVSSQGVSTMLEESGHTLHST